MPHTAARAYEQRDSVQRRSHRPRHPPNHPRTLVSASEAASGLHTGYQGTDARTNLLGTPYSVRLHPRRRTQGVRSKGGGTAPRLWRRLSSPILSSLVKKESGPRRAVDKLPGRHWLVKICKFRFAPRVAEYCSADLFLCCSNPSDQAPHQVSHGSSGHCTLFCTQKAPSDPPI